MRVRQAFAERDGVRLHYIYNPQSDGRTALIMIPGGLGHAEQYLSEMEYLDPRPTAAFSPRGCGRSDKPHSGYSPADQVADLEAFLDYAKPKSYVLFAYSMSVPAALMAALNRGPELKGVIVGDYPARFPKLTLEWVERVVMALGSEVPAYVPQALQAESVAHPIWDELAGLSCPVLLLRGDGLGSLLTEEDADAYKAVLPDVEDVMFEGSDHTLWQPDYDRFMDAITAFLDRIDEGG